MHWASEEKSRARTAPLRRPHRGHPAGAGPLTVYASYFGRESNRVASSRSRPIPTSAWRSTWTATLRLAGEPGQAVLCGHQPRGRRRVGARTGRLQVVRRQDGEDRREDRGVCGGRARARPRSPPATRPPRTRPRWACWSAIRPRPAWSSSPASVSGGRQPAGAAASCSSWPSEGGKERSGRPWKARASAITSPSPRPSAGRRRY